VVSFAETPTDFRPTELGREMVGTRSYTVLGVLSVAALLIAATALAAAHATRGPIQGKHPTGRGTSSSTNWSGYAAYGSTFTDVKGSWVQPTADCSGLKGQKLTIASFWVGLDGYTSNTVEQTGTDVDCVGTTALYYSWYEFYPASPVFGGADQTPQPGDRMDAEVSVANGTVTTTLHDVDQGWTLTATTPAAKLAFSSAEWIAEKPAHLLTSFGSVDFTSAAASTTSVNDGKIDNGGWSNDAITLVDHNGPNGTALATPTGLTRGGSSFTINAG
jgi:Peptidase A4 family